MSEREFPRVQHVPWRGILFSIERVANHRVAQMVKMNTYLVSASAVQGAFHQTDSTAGLEDAILCPGRPPATQVDVHFFSVHRMAADRSLDYSTGTLRDSRDEREICFVHLSLGELSGERGVRRIIFRHHEAAARLLVETVHNPRALFAADAGEARAMMEQGVDESMRLVARAGMHNQASRFI
jgi:hypothetical protein